MSDRVEQMKGVITRQAYSACESELWLLELIAAELDALADHPRGDLGAAYAHLRTLKALYGGIFDITCADGGQQYGR